MPKVVALPDGILASCVVVHRGPGLGLTPAEQEVSLQYSKDHGQTWSVREVVARLPAAKGGFGFGVPLADREGEIHVFLLCDGQTGVIRARTAPGVAPVEPMPRQYLGVWYLRSRGQRTAWTEAKPIFDGRASDLQSACQLRSGRIVLPLASWVNRSWRERGEGFAEFTFQGSFEATAIYSDNGGATWQRSASTLRIPTPNLSALGAIEPAIVQLNDDRVWMLIRGQTGVFYESFSTDHAVTWSPPVPSAIASSDSPAGFARLDEKRILLIWNNCRRFPYALGGRQVLHAAITEDDGQSWRGWREVLRDPLRHQPPPPSGDHGVSYPYPAVAANGRVVYSLWVQTGDGRSLFEIDPRWLLARHQRDDFADGSSEAWSHFGCRGVGVVAAEGAVGGQALRLAKADAAWPSGAVRNFPFGRRGTLTLRLRAEPAAGPLRLMLTDHFSPPFDLEDAAQSVFLTTVAVSPAANAPAIAIAPDRWATLQLQWDLAAQRCGVSIDGRQSLQLPAQRRAAGVCYLRLRADPLPAQAPGYLLDSVEVTVEP
jgi:hypothetical protein